MCTLKLPTKYKTFIITLLHYVTLAIVTKIFFKEWITIRALFITKQKRRLINSFVKVNGRIKTFFGVASSLLWDGRDNVVETSKINPKCLSLCFAKLVGLMQDQLISSAKTCRFTDSFVILLWRESCSTRCYCSILSRRKRDATGFSLSPQSFSK